MRAVYPARGSAALLLAALLAWTTPSPAQHAGHAADPADVATIDAIIAATYDVISGPAGERDWDRFRSLFLPGAFLMQASPRPETAPPPAAVSPDGYIGRAGPYFRDNPFFEVEAGRIEERFGTVAHAMSAYESRTSADRAETPFARGVNSFQLVWIGDRWYVASIIWDVERPGNAIPRRFLEPAGG